MKRFLFIAFALIPVAATAQDDEGRLVRFIEDSLSNGAAQQVDLQGFRGALSAQATLDRLTVADAEGIWLSLEGVILNWNRAALLRGAVDVTELTAERISLSRLPSGEPDPATPETQPFQVPDLPVSIEIESAAIERIEIGEAVFGTAVDASFAAALSLSGGALDTELNLNRIDGPEGMIALQATFDNAGSNASIDLSVREGPGGLTADALNIPGSPSIDLSIVGEGPLASFAAEFALATGDTPRMTGSFETSADDLGAESYSLSLNGDLTPLLQGDAIAFIGDQTELEAQAQRTAEGALTLDTLRLRSGAVMLEGELALDTNNQPTSFDFNGRLDPPQDGATLPLPGGDASISGAGFSLAYDRGQSDAVRGRAELIDLRSSALNAGSVLLGLDGQLGMQGDQITGYRGPLVVQANALGHADQDIATALGEQITFSTNLDWEAERSFQLQNLQISGDAVELGGDIELTPGNQRLDLTAALNSRANDLQVFSGLADRTLGGALAATLDLQVELLSRAFSLDLDARGEDLEADGVDPRLLAGESVLTGGISRGEAGFDLRNLSLQGERLAAEANGALSSTTAELDFSASLENLALLQANLRGPLSVSGRINRAGADAPFVLPNLDIRTDYGTLAGDIDVLPASGGADLETDVRLRLPDLAALSDVAGMDLSGAAELALRAQGNWPASLGVELTGTLQDVRAAALPSELLTGETLLSVDATISDTDISLSSAKVDGQNLTIDANGRFEPMQSQITATLGLANAAIFTSSLPGPVTLEADASQNADAPWQLDATATGPGGLILQVDGETDGGAATDLNVTGRAPLGLANRFIEPRSLSGDLSIDLRVDGQPSLGSINGVLSTNNARLAAPSLNVAVEGINARVALAQSAANITANGSLNTGGQLGIDGRIDLGSAALPAQVSVLLQNATLVDPTLYQANITRAALELSGALAGRSNLAGDVNLGDVEIRVPDGGLGGSGTPIEINHIGETAAEQRTRRYAGLLSSGSGGGGGNSSIGLDIGVDAPGRIFIRGRGLDAELGGNVRVTGTTAAPVASGQFDLIRGRLTILGQRLELTRGSATLSGGDPFIDLLAETSTPDYQIFIGVQGLASAPEITFTSSPELPEDEVLAQLFFNRSVNSLSPIQALQLADAVAGLAGGGSGVFSRLRDGLGLDNLDIQTDEAGNAAVRAGRYISENIYTDIVVDDEGAGVSLNIDITPSLTARGGVSGDGESSLGVFFERDY